MRTALAATAAGLLLAGCALPAGPAVVTAAASRSPAVTAMDTGYALIALSRPGGVPTSATAGAPAGATLPARTPEGSRTALLVDAEQGHWLRVLLPGRPNGRHAWVRDDQVDRVSTDWHLSVSLSGHRLQVWRGWQRVGDYPVGVGRAVTPTPAGRWFVTDLLRPPDPAGAYGPWAFGLSAYSTVLTSFGGGPGQIGLHGTDDPASVGHDASHGCLRLTNDVITGLARQLPLGTPVDVTA